MEAPLPGWDTAWGCGGCRTRPAGPPGGSCTRPLEQLPRSLQAEGDTRQLRNSPPTDPPWNNRPTPNLHTAQEDLVKCWHRTYAPIQLVRHNVPIKTDSRGEEARAVNKINLSWKVRKTKQHKWYKTISVLVTSSNCEEASQIQRK